MVDRIKNAIADKLYELYPDLEINDEHVSNKCKSESFFIDIIDQDYASSIFNSGKSTVQIDISYFPKKSNEQNIEMERVKSNLLRELKVVDGFRILSKTSNIVDDVLHLHFQIKYTEQQQDNAIKVEQFALNQKLKER